MRHNSPGNDCLLNLVTKFIQAKYAIAKQNKQIDAKKKANLLSMKISASFSQTIHTISPYLYEHTIKK